MPITKKPDQDFVIKDDYLELTDNYLSKYQWSFKKITGTRLSSILGFNTYQSEFKTWMVMTGIFKDVMDPTLAKVGSIIEPKIRTYVENETKIKFLSYDPKSINFDLFKDNKIFGGIPDGEPLGNNGQINYHNQPMLEIKTTSKDSFNYKFENNNLMMIKNADLTPSIKEINGKYKTWFKDDKIQIPIDYLAQLGLYMFLKKIQCGLFAIAFLETSDYVNPEAFNANDREIHLVDFKLNLEKFQKYIDYATEWYKKYITTGKSPKMTKEDKIWLKKELELI